MAFPFDDVKLDMPDKESIIENELIKEIIIMIKPKAKEH